MIEKITSAPKPSGQIRKLNEIIDLVNLIDAEGGSGGGTAENTVKHFLKSDWTSGTEPDTYKYVIAEFIGSVYGVYKQIGTKYTKINCNVIITEKNTAELISIESFDGFVVFGLAKPVKAKEAPPSGGKDGKSAYEIALENGFVGTEREWLASLKGPKGDDGQDGAAGQNGFSPSITVAENTDTAFKLYINNETGTLITPNLKGEKGDPATNLVKSVNGQTGEVVIDVPTNTNQLMNGSGYITISDLTPYAKAENMNQQLASINATLINKIDKTQAKNFANKTDLSSFVKNVTESGKIITVTKGDGTTNTIDLSTGETPANNKRLFTKKDWIGNSLKITNVETVYGVFQEVGAAYEDAIVKISISGNNATLTASAPFSGYAIVGNSKEVTTVVAEKAIADAAGNDIAATYAKTSYIDEKIGNIDSVLDIINGEVI